jgi:hypothetical protein
MPTIKRRLRSALEPKPPSNEGPLAAWGPSLSTSSQNGDVDGAVVGGVRLVRGPDGGLVGIVEPPEEPAP